MAKLTRLEFVQRVLARIDAENVTSTDETVESDQVLGLLNEAYEEFFEFPWPNLRTKGNLEVTSTAHEMKLPTDVLGIDWIRYNGKDLTWKEPLEMETLLDSRDTSLSNVDSNGALTDQDPTYWTTYDDATIIMDSYDGSLVSALATCQFSREPTPMTDDLDMPDLPSRLHPVLFDRVCALAFATLLNDFNNYKIYNDRYTQQYVKMKRWARRVNREDSTYGDDYSRQTR